MQIFITLQETVRELQDPIHTYIGDGHVLTELRLQIVYNGKASEYPNWKYINTEVTLNLYLRNYKIRMKEINA